MDRKGYPEKMHVHIIVNCVTIFREKLSRHNFQVKADYYIIGIGSLLPLYK